VKKPLRSPLACPLACSLALRFARDACVPLLPGALAVAGCASEPADAPPPHLSWVEPVPLRAEPGRHTVAVTSSRQVVPGPGLPAGLTLGASNNNVDVVRHEGRVYMGFRTAPSHFASADTRMYVLSSADEETWQLEQTFALGTDVREPRFLSFGSKLFFYLSVLGKDRLAFEPQGVRFVEKTVAGWSPLETFASDDRIVWRTRVHGGRAYMSAYDGGKHIYDFDGQPLDVRFTVSDDGRAWRAVGPREAIYQGGASETDFTWDEAGDLWFVMRTEAFDRSGVGSKLCVARGGDVAALYCRSDPKKYDSPFLFTYDGEVYLIGRRNLTETGYYIDPSLDLASFKVRDVVYAQLDYRNASKRCALWRVVKGEMRVAYLIDLPSNGDTCFASVIAGAKPNEFVVYDYSTDPGGGDRTWIQGQEGETNLYRHVLTFAPR
jgi:hypothetical protein